MMCVGCPGAAWGNGRKDGAEILPTAFGPPGPSHVANPGSLSVQGPWSVLFCVLYLPHWFPMELMAQIMLMCSPSSERHTRPENEHGVLLPKSIGLAGSLIQRSKSGSLTFTGRATPTRGASFDKPRAQSGPKVMMGASETPPLSQRVGNSHPVYKVTADNVPPRCVLWHSRTSRRVVRRLVHDVIHSAVFEDGVAIRRALRPQLAAKGAHLANNVEGGQRDVRPGASLALEWRRGMDFAVCLHLQRTAVAWRHACAVRIPSLGACEAAFGTRCRFLVPQQHCGGLQRLAGQKRLQI
eukprot:6652569-Prymnesium_polylepis.1